MQKIQWLNTVGGLRTALIALVLVVALAGCGGGAPSSVGSAFEVCADATPMPRTSVSSNKQYSSAPPVTIDRSKQYTACFTTTRGSFEIELFVQQAPITVNNFVFLANDGFYDGLNFHRVIKAPSLFMAQGGDPAGNGTGGPGYQWADEPGALALPHDTPGILSMANAGPNTNGSQFFITFVPTPHLNGAHAVFGRVRGDGMTVVNAIEQGDVIQSVTIVQQ